MKKICETCKYFEPNEERNGFNGFCDKATSQENEMNSNQFAILCGHDGPIYVGKDFGCVNWKRRK